MAISRREPGAPRRLFHFYERDLPLCCYPNRCFDVSRDGSRFYGLRFVPRAPKVPVTHVSLAPDFFEELKAKVR